MVRTITLWVSRMSTSRRELTKEEKSWQKNLRDIWEKKKDKLGLTQEKLAAKIGWKTQAAVTSYLNGRIPLNTDAKIKFAKALEVHVSEIDPEIKDLIDKTPTTAKDYIDTYRESLMKLPSSELLKLSGGIETYILEAVKEQEARNKLEKEKK